MSSLGAATDAEDQVSAAERAEELRGVLADMGDRAEYALMRKPIADKFDVRVCDVDALWEQAHGRSHGSDASDASDGKSQIMWPEPVDGSELIVDLCAALENFIITSKHAIMALALWILHTHAHGAASKSPILCIWGPMPDCGKSTALDLLSRLVANVLRGAGLSLAYVLRVAAGRTVCWDEVDKEFKKRGQDIDGWFTLGWQRGRLYGRADPNDPHATVEYDPWCAKAIAMIGKPWDQQVLSRCILIEMRRKLEGEEAEEYHDTEPYPELSDLQRRAARWSADHLSDLRHARPERPDGLRSTRPFDNWRPLLAIADAIGGQCPAQAREAAVALQPKNERDRTVELLGDLHTIFEEVIQTRDDFCPSSEIVEALRMMPEREYDVLNRGRPVSQKWLSNQLAPFSIESDQPRRNGHKGPRGYHAAQFTDAFERYLSHAIQTDPSDPSDPEALYRNEEHGSGGGSDGSDGSDGKAVSGGSSPLGSDLTVAEMPGEVEPW